jgi:lactate dehydrogenase-like 2-hydroxyacid dehydrogenase
MARVLVTRPLPDPVLEALHGLADLTLRAENRPMSVDEMTASLRDFDIVLPTLGDLYSAQVFAAVAQPRCKLLANFGVGYNHIDAVAAGAAGVAVTNTPGAVTEPTADIALMLMLMTARRAGEGERLVRAGRWQGWHPTQMLGLHLGGKTCGVIGMGRIGKAIARRAHLGLGMEVVFFNRSPVADAGVPARQLGSVAEVMGAADVVVLAVPGGPATRHLIDAAAIAAMQPHAHLVNIARGDVVDEAALIAALQDGRIAGAGLDVYEREPEVPEALRALPNVVLLPHLGTAALEVRTAMGMIAVDNIAAHLRGETLPNRV